MKRNARVALALGALTLVTGVPAYLLLDHFRLLPVALKDRPWPQAALGLVMIGAIVVFARRCTEARERRIAFSAAALGAISIASLSGVASATYALPPSELPTGKRLPDFSLRDETGRTVTLASSSGSPAVLIFFRGAFCAYCRKELARLSEQAPAFMAHGVRIFGISADPPDIASDLKKTLGIPFGLLSDDEQRLAVELCGVNAHCEVIVDQHGVVRWVGLNDSWRTKLRPEVLFEAAYRSDAL